MQLPSRWQWKLNRARQQWAERWGRTRTLANVVQNQQRMCPECRALVDRGESKCPMCGTPLRGVSRGVAGRSMDLALPAHGRVTYIIALVNGLLFLLTLIATLRSAEGEFGLRTLLGSIDSLALVRYGAKWGPLISAGDWWRLVTPVFLHADILHLGMNTWVLLDLGPNVENLYGRRKFWVMYLLCGIGGAMASYLWRPNSLSIGASGAIFGLIGVMIGRSYQFRGTHASPERAVFVRWAVYMLLFGFIVPIVDNSAHIGGLIVGLALGYLISDLPAEETSSAGMWKALQVAAVLLVAVSFVMVGLHPRV